MPLRRPCRSVATVLCIDKTIPPSRLPFLPFMAVFLISILFGMASHVPGGLGVFEGLMILMLKAIPGIR